MHENKMKIQKWFLVVSCCLFLLTLTDAQHPSFIDEVETTPAPTFDGFFTLKDKLESMASPYVHVDGLGAETTFTFTPTSFIQIGPEDISSFQIRNRRSVSLEFRTRLPDALLLYHGIKNRPLPIQKYELYVMLDQGQLKVKHLLGDHSTTLTVGKALNQDRWHKVTVSIDPTNRTILAKVDDEENITPVNGLKANPMYGAGKIDLESLIFIGGLNASTENLEISYLANTFIGCIRNASLETSLLISAPLEELTSLVSKQHNNIRPSCINKCWERTVKCSRDSHCINHYDHVVCDCFQARFKGDRCKDTSVTELTLSGYSYVTFTVFEWMNRVHSDTNRISMTFKTKVDDSILFYAAGELPDHNHIAASIGNHSVIVDIDFGDGDTLRTRMSDQVTDGNWHTLTIFHSGKNITIFLDEEERKYVLRGNNPYLYIHPDIYIGGGGPILKNREGLTSSNSFVGCLKEVYFNEKSILYELKENSHQTRHHGVTKPKFGECSPRATIPITLSFPKSGFRIENPNPSYLDLTFSFRITELELYGTLAYSKVTKPDQFTDGYWELKFTLNEIAFEVQLADYGDKSKISLPYNRKNPWHKVNLIKHANGSFSLHSESGVKTLDFPFDTVHTSQIIILGTSERHPKDGFVGCLQKVSVNGKHVDPRSLIGSKDQIGDLALDNCQFVDPCARPNVCGHGGKCIVNSNREKFTCDCNHTGYIGDHCHFATNKRTCEELALLGYTNNESGVHEIDIDGNGPYPPTHVKCKFATTSTGESKTIVEHNLANETIVWGKHGSSNSSSPDLQFTLTYREFSPEMLLSLISQSVQCTQHIKFDCHKVKLGLHQYTWFKSADPSANKVVSIGDARRNTCPCFEKRNCYQGGHCNCDSGAEDWLHDEGFFTIPDRLGIVEMNFIRPHGLDEDAEARITLGPLECVEANTQRYVVTFKTFGSYLEAPGWKSGDLAFSFRTTKSSAILLFQPLLHPQHNSFSVFLSNNHELTFRFILNGGNPQKITVRSQRPLSGGDWQQVWIDYDMHQVRFQINGEHQMINLNDGQQFGPFEGTMFVAGAPEQHLKDIEVREGLIGCFRGLVMNGQVLDLYSYMKFHKADIAKDCSPSCEPNPCKNGGVCAENWGSYKCICENPFAHSGEHCEIDINTDGLTFLSQKSYIKEQKIEENPISDFLQSNISLNIRTYDKEALVLYANDNLNNFVQLHLEKGTHLKFTWNEEQLIRSLIIDYKGLNHGRSIQIAVVRNNTHVTLHVNEQNVTIQSNLTLLSQYKELPWINPEKELFTPPRPFAPVVPYHQVFLGGFDNIALKPVQNATAIPGMLGCFRGLKVAGYVMKIANYSNDDDVLKGCKMICDSIPCKNNGLCLENFSTRTFTCDCTYTSFQGDYCTEGKGGRFKGASLIRRKLTNPTQSVSSIEARFGFNLPYSPGKHILWTLLLPGQDYYLLFAVDSSGHLLIREKNGEFVTGATILYQHFADGSRHAVYFKRTATETLLIVDHQQIELMSFKSEDVPLLTSEKNETTTNDGVVFIGGVTEYKGMNASLFKRFKKFNGCMSNVYIKIGDFEIEPLEEYMGDKNSPAEGVNPKGMSRATSCKSIVGSKNTPPASNGTSVEDNWIVWTANRTELNLTHIIPKEQGGISFETWALFSGLYLLILVICVICYMHRLHKRYKRRIREEEDRLIYSQPFLYNEMSPSGYKSPTYIGFELANSNNAEGEKANSSSHIINGTQLKKNSSLEKLIRREGIYAEGRESSPGDTQEEIDADNASSDTTSENSGRISSDCLSNHDDLQATDGATTEDDKVLLYQDANLVDAPTASVSEVTLRPHEDLHPAALDSNGVFKRTRNSINSRPRDLNSPTYGNSDTNNIDYDKGKEELKGKLTSPVGPLSQIYISDTCRTIPTSPIAVIGGSRWEDLKRRSIDSVLSLD